jgi:hypothetical protein
MERRGCIVHCHPGSGVYIPASGSRDGSVSVAFSLIPVCVSAFFGDMAICRAHAHWGRDGPRPTYIRSPPQRAQKCPRMARGPHVAHRRRAFSVHAEIEMGTGHETTREATHDRGSKGTRDPGEGRAPRSGRARARAPAAPRAREARPTRPHSPRTRAMRTASQRRLLARIRDRAEPARLVDVNS